MKLIKGGLVLGLASIPFIYTDKNIKSALLEKYKELSSEEVFDNMQNQIIRVTNRNGNMFINTIVFDDIAIGYSNVRHEELKETSFKGIAVKKGDSEIELNYVKTPLPKDIYMFKLKKGIKNDNSIDLNKPIQSGQKLLVYSSEDHSDFNLYDTFITKTNILDYAFSFINHKTSQPNTSRNASIAFNYQGLFSGIVLPHSNRLIDQNYFRDIANRYKDKGKVEKPYLGLSAITAKNDDENVGVLILNINLDSPADKSGLVLGERITAVNDIPIHNIEDFSNMIGYAYKSSIKLSVTGKAMPRTVILEL